MRSPIVMIGLDAFDPGLAGRLTASGRLPRIARLLEQGGHCPYVGWRTGDHFPEGLLLASGPGFAAGISMPAIAVEDLGPSLAARLGVTLDNVDGKPVSWLAGESEPTIESTADEPPARAYG